MSLDFAKAAIWGDGSDPMDKMQISGVLGSDSFQVTSKSRIHGSPYWGPKESESIIEWALWNRIKENYCCSNETIFRSKSIRYKIPTIWNLLFNEYTNRYFRTLNHWINTTTITKWPSLKERCFIFHPKMVTRWLIHVFA